MITTTDVIGCMRGRDTTRFEGTESEDFPDGHYELVLGGRDTTRFEGTERIVSSMQSRPVPDGRDTTRFEGTERQLPVANGDVLRKAAEIRPGVRIRKTNDK